MEQIRAFEGGLNTDDSQETMSPADYQYLLNGIKAKSYGGQGGTIENQQGTTALGGISELDANSTCIGAVRDQKSSAWYAFFYNTNPTKNCIVKLNSSGVTKIFSCVVPAWVTGTTYAIGAQVLYNNTVWQSLTAHTDAVAPVAGSVWRVVPWGISNLSAWVTGTTYAIGDQVTYGGYSWTSLTAHTDSIAPVSGSIWSLNPVAGLNFNLSYLITGGAANGGVVYFTDALNGLRAISTTKYSTGASPYIPFVEEEIALLKRGGIIPPTFAKSHDSSVDANQTGRFSFQFAYQYVYEDNQFSVLSPYSTLCRVNNSAQNYNKVTIGISDPIPTNVKTIKFVARNSNSSAFLYIGDYQKPTTGWPASLTFPFYNNSNGAVVASVYESQFHAVPIIAKCMETIKNRLWLGNYLEGYDTPLDAGISVDINNQEIVAGSTIGVTKKLFSIKVTSWAWAPIPKSYRLLSVSEFGSFIDPVVTSNLDGTSTVTGHGVIAGTPNYTDYPTNDISEVCYDVVPSYFVGPEIETCQLVTGVSISYLAPSVSAADYDGSISFASGSSYKVGYIFKDNLGRTSGVVSGQSSVFNTNDSAYYNSLKAIWKLPLYWSSTTTYVAGNTVLYGNSVWTCATGNINVTPVAGANWTLVRSSIIPSWAKTYSIVMSKNLTKSYFLEYRSAVTSYSLGTTQSFGAYNAVNDSISIDVTAMTRAGIGYIFSEGDRIRIYPTTVDGVSNGVSTVFDVPITGFDGNLIKVANIDIGTLNSSNQAKTTFEIYRPILTKNDVLYYEIGQSYPITVQPNGDLDFSSHSASLPEDCAIVSRSNYALSGADYIVDTHQPKGLYKAINYDPLGLWETGSGKPYIETSIGQVQKNNYFRFSSTIINGTNVNGLCEFYAADESNTPQEHGDLNKLKNVSREKDEATILLGICRNGTSSIYIDQTHMNLDQTTSFLVQSVDVIGGDKSLKGGYGTINPESVFDLNDDVYWYDAISGKYIRYASNGMFAISDYKMMHHFEDMRAALKATPSRVVGGYDPFYRLVYVSCSSSASGRKTTSWSEGINRWISFHSFVGDWYFDIEGIGYSVKAGTFYSHNNAAAFNTFYGTVYDTVLEVNFNDSASVPKYWNAVGILLSPNFWTWSAGEQVIATGVLKFDLENGTGQGTDVSGARWDFDENIGYGAIMKNRNTAGVSDPYINGDDMFSHIALGRVTIYGQANDVFKRINFVKIGYDFSKGHQL